MIRKTCGGKTSEALLLKWETFEKAVKEYRRLADRKEGIWKTVKGRD